MTPIDFDNYVEAASRPEDCGSVAPWKAVYENLEFDVYCQADKGHLGRHGGNGWTWDDDRDKDDYPLSDQEIAETEAELLSQIRQHAQAILRA